jgi:ribonuclease H
LGEGFFPHFGTHSKDSPFYVTLVRLVKIGWKVRAKPKTGSVMATADGGRRTADGGIAFDDGLLPPPHVYHRSILDTSIFIIFIIIMTNKATNDHEDQQEQRNPHEDVYCYCLHASVCNKCGKPRSDRSATRDAIQHILKDPRPARANVFGHGPLLVSDPPKSAQSSSIVLGIDEAGRGSVLGPMVYGLAYWAADAVDRIPKSFNDSKQLSEDTREKLWKEILQHEDIGFALKALLPNEISRNMLRVNPYNLNEQSHDTAMTLIRKVMGHHTIQTCFIDTVGNAGAYQRKLERAFPNIEFVVESKADAKYASCSAASVGT